MTDNLIILNYKMKMERGKVNPNLSLMSEYEREYETVSNQILQLLIKYRSPIAEKFIKRIINLPPLPAR